jgi:hypothetical protein
MRFAGVGGRSAVAAKYLAASPSQPHQVGFAAALGEPGVGERVPKLAWVQPR